MTTSPFFFQRCRGIKRYKDRNISQKNGWSLLLLLLLLLLILFSAPYTFASEKHKAGLLDYVSSSKNNNQEETIFDPDAQPPLAIRIRPCLSLGAKLTVEAQWYDNGDLDDSVADDVMLLEYKLGFAALYEPRPDIDLLGEVRVTHLSPLKDSSDRESGETEVELRKAYLLWMDAFDFPINIQIGRRKFKDDREWLYDEGLDALRILYKGNRLAVDMSVSRKLFNTEDKIERDITNYVVSSTYRYGKKDRIAAYGILRQDWDEEGRDRVWFGFSWRGRPYEDLKSWADLALLRGNGGSANFRGLGVDVGGIFCFDHLAKTSFTLSYAYGSGDSDLNDKVDKTFRQTGLQDNEGRFNGVTKFKYYGEVFDPELSNISIWTLGFGIRPTKNTSFDLVYHYYTRVKKDGPLGDHEVDADLTGNDRQLGQEIDIILGVRVKKNVRLALTEGVFRPGNTFVHRDKAYFGEIKLQFSF